jgi:hypothetical protein
LRGLKEKYELHHGIRISDSAIVAAATLSNRYITDRFMPDKAIDLVDEAASRLRMEVDSKPEEIDEYNQVMLQEGIIISDSIINYGRFDFGTFALSSTGNDFRNNNCIIRQNTIISNLISN